MAARTRTTTLALAIIVLLVAACTGDLPQDAAAPSPAVAAVTEAPETRPPAFALALSQASGHAVGRPLRPEELAGPAEAVRRRLEGFLATAFAQPADVRGAPTGFLEHFAASAREQAVDDLARLSLGAAAREIASVWPGRASLELELLTDRGGHPVVAFATVDLEATAVAGETKAPIRHHGEYVLRRTGGAWRIVSYEVHSRVPRPAQLRAETGEAAFAPGVPSSGPMFVLVIGSDARPGQSVTHTRADSIHIVGVNPRLGRASILGIPRDSWVPIPGYGSDKINAALVLGGPDLLVESVERLSGVPIDAYVLTGFEGFQAAVDAVGGLDVVVPFPIEDAYAKADFDRGPEHVDGRDALALARARHDLPDGDFGRSLNQGRLLVAAIATLRDQVATHGPVALLPWALAGAEHLRSDLAFQEMFSLLAAAPAFDERRTVNEVATGHVGSIGGKSVVILDGGAYAQMRDLAKDADLSG